MSKVSLTRLERYFLSNQLRILEALYPDEAESLSIKREAIENGYELLYGWDLEHIYDGSSVMTPSECEEVLETLAMCDAIDRATREAGDIENKSFAKFSGYDGNNESKFKSFAEFMMRKRERFSYLPLQKDNYWNSHMPMRHVYQRMLDEWHRVSETRRYALSREETAAILAAAIHPESRKSV